MTAVIKDLVCQVCQAGTLKRNEPDADENPVLMRALRDFNTPKITTLDMPIFLRLIKDLFPGIDVPRATGPPRRAQA